MESKIIIIVLVLILIAKTSLPQCNCQTNYIENKKVVQCIPSLVAYDSYYQIGLSISKVEEQTFLLVTVRFQNSAKKIGSNLIVFTDDETVLNLELVDSEKDYVGESEICHAKYKLDTKSINILSKNILSSLRFNFYDEDIKRTFGIKKNERILISQLACI